MKLRPFAVTLRLRGREPLAVEGRVEDGAFRVQASGHAVVLPGPVHTDALGLHALPEAAVLALGPGLRLRVEHGGLGEPPLTLIVEPVSGADERAAPLLRRLGGDPTLVRLIAPPAWSARIPIGADGTVASRRPPTLH